MASQMRPALALMKTMYTCGGSAGFVVVIALLQLCLERGQGRSGAFRVFVDPSVVNEADGDRIDEVQLLSPFLARDDEAGLFEDAQVLHDSEASHRGSKGGLELAERAGPALEQEIEQRAARR